MRGRGGQRAGRGGRGGRSQDPNPRGGTPPGLIEVPDRPDRGQIHLGDYPNRPNSTARIARVLNQMNLSESELENRMRRVIPENRKDLYESCILAAKQFDEGCIQTQTANGFITKDGRQVIQAAPPRHRGVYLYKLTEYALKDREDIENVQTSMTFNTTDLQIAIPTDLALYWRINSVYYYSPNDVHYSRVGGYINAFTKLSMCQSAREATAVQYALLRHHTNATHCSGRFRNSQMNPLVSICSERHCYERKMCRPIYVETHLVRSYLFWVQVYVALTSALPLKARPDFAAVMAEISSRQGGMRTADQVDISGIFNNLSAKYKDSRPSDQAVMDQDMFVICGNNQTKLKRDFEGFVEGAVGDERTTIVVVHENYTCVRDANGCYKYQPLDQAGPDHNKQFPCVRLRISDLTFGEILHLTAGSVAMICKHFLPQDPAIRTAREGQLNSFVLDEVSICSFIRLFRDLGFFSASRLDANVVLAIDRFMKAHNN